MNINQIVSLVTAHWELALTCAWLASDVTVAVTPKRYQSEKWYGLALKLFRLTSAHIHWDEPSLHSLQIPVLGIPIQFGKPAASTTPASPDATAKVQPSDASS